MNCKVCNKINSPPESEECFEKALDILKGHYVYYKNALRQRDIELQQIKERNEQLNKALQLLQKNQHPSKRFKSQNINESWLESDISQDQHAASELVLTDDEAIGATNLNIALNSEQLFDTSLSQAKTDISTTSSEMVQSLRTKVSPKRNKQRDTIRCFKERTNRGLGRSKSEWHTKDRKSPGEKSWAMKFLQPTKSKFSEEKMAESKKTADKKLSLSLKKTSTSKMKQSLIDFSKSKDIAYLECDIGEDAIDESLVITKKSKAGRSWTHRSVHNDNSNSSNIAKDMVKQDNILDDIVFDFSPSKKTDVSLNEDLAKNLNPKKLKFDSEISKDCISAPRDDDLGILTNRTDSSSIVILTPTSEDIIFVEDDTCNIEPEIDTMDLLNSTANLEKLKDYESKCIKKQQSKDIDPFKKPSRIQKTKVNANTLKTIKQENTTQDNLLAQRKVKEAEEEKPSCSKSSSHIKGIKHQNPLLSSDEQDTEDFMPKPFIIKQEAESSTALKKLSIKKRFNIDCEDCEKLINFFDERLTDEQIQQHLDKCKSHNNPDAIRHQNTPKDFWNPFILSFQADDPRNEVLIDNRFKDNKN